MLKPSIDSCTVPRIHSTNFLCWALEIGWTSLGALQRFRCSVSFLRQPVVSKGELVMVTYAYLLTGDLSNLGRLSHHFFTAALSERVSWLKTADCQGLDLIAIFQSWIESFRRVYWSSIPNWPIIIWKGDERDRIFKKPRNICLCVST